MRHCAANCESASLAPNVDGWPDYSFAYKRILPVSSQKSTTEMKVLDVDLLSLEKGDRLDEVSWEIDLSKPD